MNIDELSQYLGIKKSTLYSLVERRAMPFYKIGRLVRFKKSDIDAWIAGLKSEVLGPQAEAKKILNKARPDIRGVIRKNVAQVKRLVYTSKYGRPDEVKGLGKEAKDVS